MFGGNFGAIIRVLVAVTIRETWGRPGFDVGSERVQGIPRTDFLVNPFGKKQTQTTNVLLSQPKG